MLSSVVEGSNNSSKLRRGALVTRQLVEIRILLMPQNKMVGLARPREMCVSLPPLTSEARLTLDTEVAPDSDHLDSEDEVQIRRKRKVSKAALEKQKMAAKKRAKKRKDDDDDDDDYKDDEDEYTALSKSLWKSKSTNAKPSNGSFEKCAKCSKRFTVVRSSMVCGEHPINYNL
jgi:hypothetical protein